jgi:hypothetical protein
MKSEERHRLETNVVADRLAVYIEKLRPYATSLAGIALFVMIAMFVWTYLRGTSALRQSQAWDAYNDAVVSPMPNLELLRESAEEHPGTKMQQLANITWADGQVWIASRDYLNNKAAAKAALRNATSAYQSILASSDNQRLLNRAHLGLARVYEMQDELDKAREEYSKVTGSYAKFAEDRAKVLDEKKTQDAIAWLATATPPRRPSPTGPGTPGKAPSFSFRDMPMPDANTGGGASTDGVGEGASLDALLQGLNLDSDSGDSADRYNAEEAPPTAEKPAEEATPATGTEPAKEAEPTADKPSDDKADEQPKQ